MDFQGDKHNPSQIIRVCYNRLYSIQERYLMNEGCRSKDVVVEFESRADKYTAELHVFETYYRDDSYHIVVHGKIWHQSDYGKVYNEKGITRITFEAPSFDVDFA